MRRVLAAIVLALAVLAAGCGDSGESDIDQARNAVSDYFVAIADGDGERACDLMSEEAQQRFAEQVAGETTCVAAVERLREGLDDEDLAPLRDPQVDVTLNRDKATASVENGPSDITVIKVGGTWVIDAD